MFKNRSQENIRKEVVLYDKVQAPVSSGDKIGDIIYYYDNEKIGIIDILAAETVNKAGFKDCLLKTLKKYFLATK